MIPHDKRIKEIEEKIKGYKCVNDFYIAHPYLYRWALKHNVDVKKYLPKKPINCKLDDRANKGIDCYIAKTKKFYKHYAFMIDALRDLDLTYYYVNRVLNGIIPSINGYTFVKC